MPPISLLIKPASGNCNLRCEYCFYADEMENRRVANYGKMSSETLEILVQKAFEHAETAVTFGFQGGEPTLMGLPFFETFCKFRDQYNTKKLKVFCSLQTNGTLLDEAWAEFLAREKFLVGVSMDGPRSVHDKYRLSVGKEGTFQKTLKGIRLLEEAGTQFNILTVLTEDSAKEADRIYRFFRNQGFLYQQYIPCLEPLDGDQSMQAGCPLSAKTYGKALKELFDLWFEDIQRGIPVYNRFFENLVGIAAGREPESCDMVGHCSVQYVAEADGSIYPCDFYVLDEYRLGNITENSFAEIDRKRTEIRFLEDSGVMAEKCKNCRWKQLCRGGCRRNRPMGENHTLLVSRFCEAYQEFYPYAAKRLQYLAERIR